MEEKHQWRTFLLLLVCGWMCASADAQIQQSFLVVAPLSLRLDASEKVLVQVFGFSQPVEVYVSLRKTMGHTHLIQEHVTLSPANGHMGEVMLRLFPDMVEADRKTVVLQVQSDGINKHLEVPLSRTNGFMFIQTDKPLYTPTQTVKVRAFSLNQELRPADRSVFLTFRDPEHEKVDVVEVRDISNGMPSLRNPFRIPINPKLGVWTIEASYIDHFDTKASTTFEVREYVLPSFTVLIEPTQNYVSHNNFNNFRFKVSAKYLHGAPVGGGEMFLRYGSVSGKSAPVIIPSSVSRERLSSTGEKEVTVNLQKIFSKNRDSSIDQLRHKYLYIAVLLKENTGGISQEAELSSVKFVESPYKLGLVSTPPFIKPGLPYHIQVVVKDHLDEPVRKVQVRLVERHLLRRGRESEPLSCSPDTSTSQDDGIAFFSCNIKMESLSADLRFVTEDPLLPPQSQASLSFKAVSYDSPNARYLYIDPAPIHTAVGGHTQVMVYSVGPAYLSVKTLSYLFISKGKLLKAGYIPFDAGSGDKHIVRFQVTADMVPSVRLLVYYLPYGEATTELVADSVWLNIPGDCVNGIKTELKSQASQSRPQRDLQMEVKVNQDSGYIALTAIDTGVYSLRPNYRDPLSRVLRHIESADLGCGGGGGKSAADVFRLAGLSFMTNANAGVSDTSEPCTAVVRPKRAVSEEEKERKLSDYRHEAVKNCCRSGMAFSPTYRTCSQFAEMVYKDKPLCQKAFRECCVYIQQTLDRDYVLGRTELGGDFNKVPTLVRSNFPESWLWEVREIRGGTLSLSKKLPDSLTTWIIKAVGMFDNGICVARTAEVSVNLPLSVDVPLPYQIIRGEQVELRGSVYNQQPDPVKFCVVLTVGPELCLVDSRSNAGSKQRSTVCQERTLSGGGVGIVRFTLMALEAGKHTLTFTLRTRQGDWDMVKKTLNVVPEGVVKEVMVGGHLDPGALYGSQKLKVELKSHVPLNIVPNTPVQRMLTINGEMMDEFLSVADDPEGLKKLLNLRDGSAESELGGVLPVLHVFQYLETTARWHVLGPDEQKSSQQLQNRIREGVAGVTSFRKKDFSFSMWMNKESSTWVTALAVQTLAMVHPILAVDVEDLAKSVNWLILRTQNSDGSFRETSGYKPNKIMALPGESVEKSVYLTSFVLIALHKATKIKHRDLELQSQETSIQSAMHYITQNAAAVKKVYVLSVATYALTLHNPNSIGSNNLLDRLEGLAKSKGNPAELRYWQEAEVQTEWLKPDQTSGQTVETTAYALLAFLLKGRFQYGNAIVTWLTQDQHYGGGYYTLQDTLMTLEAITLYCHRVPRAELDQNIRVRFSRESDLDREVHLHKRAPVATPIQISKNSAITAVTALGRGVSYVKLKTVYYETVPPQKDCYFDITLELLKSGSTDRSLTAPHLVACAQYRPPPNELAPESMLTVMEILLPSGVEPYLDDLRPLRDSDDPIIAHYQQTGNMVVIQVHSVPADRPLCVGFRIRTAFTVGGTSDTVFTVYEDQAKGAKCVKQVSDQEQKIHRLCQYDQCQCVTAVCSLFRASVDTTLTFKQRVQETCNPDVKYVFKVQILTLVPEGDFMTYTASIIEVINSGTEFEAVGGGTEVDLLKKTTCNSVNVQKDQQYLIYGVNGLEVTQGQNYRYRFPLDGKVVMEAWPTDCEQECAELGRLSWVIQVSGCQGALKEAEKM